MDVSKQGFPSKQSLSLKVKIQNIFHNNNNFFVCVLAVMMIHEVVRKRKNLKGKKILIFDFYLIFLFFSHGNKNEYGDEISAKDLVALGDRQSQDYPA